MTTEYHPFGEKIVRIGNIPLFVRWCRQEFRENPLVGRVWGKYRKWYYLGAFAMLLGWFQIGMTLVDSLPHDFFLREVLQVIAMLVSCASCFMYLYLVILFVMGVHSYGPNVYQMTFGEDAGLRAAPLDFNERFAAIVVPLAYGILLILAPYLIIGLLILMVMIPLGLVYLLQGISLNHLDALLTGFFMLMYTLLSWVYYFVFTIAIFMMVNRRVLQHPKCGAKPQTGFFYVAGPFITMFLISALLCGLSCLCMPLGMLGLVDIFQTSGEGSGDISLRSILMVLGAVALYIGGTLLPPIVCLAIFKDWLEKDLSDARKYLFQPDE